MCLLHMRTPYEGGGIVGFAERGRHNVVDAEQLNRLKPYSRMWEVGSPETATEEYSRLISQRARLIEAVGARYIVTGTVTGYTFSHESKDGKDSFKSVFVLLLSGYDILTGKSLSPEEIKLSGQGGETGCRRWQGHRKYEIPSLVLYRPKL